MSLQDNNNAFKSSDETLTVNASLFFRTSLYFFAWVQLKGGKKNTLLVIWQSPLIFRLLVRTQWGESVPTVWFMWQVNKARLWMGKHKYCKHGGCESEQRESSSLGHSLSWKEGEEVGLKICHQQICVLGRGRALLRSGMCPNITQNWVMEAILFLIHWRNVFKCFMSGRRHNLMSKNMRERKKKQDWLTLDQNCTAQLD